MLTRKRMRRLKGSSVLVADSYLKPNCAVDLKILPAYEAARMLGVLDAVESV